MTEIGEDADSQYLSTWSRKLLRFGVEARGIRPVPVDERTDTQFSKIFFIWLSSNFNILSFSAGTLGPAVYGLSLRDSCLVILFFNLLCAALPAYLSTWGPRLGLRQMCQARYSFGYFGVILPCILNLVGMTGFCIINGILGGQTISAVSNGHVSWTVGIVVITIVSLLISFCGYKVLNWYERVCWIPVLIVYVVGLGVGGHHLSNPPPAEPATVVSILSFASTIAGFVITYAPLGSDFTIYMKSTVPSWKIFSWAYAGFLLPIVSVQCLGAAVANVAPLVPSWEAGYADGNVGGLLQAMLAPTGGFGKFLTVLLSLSVTANMAMTMYSFCLNVQVFVPFLVALPRYVFSLVATAIIIPLAIVGSHRFYSTLSNFLGIIGYWASAFGAIILLEHFLFRRGSFPAYDLRQWNTPRQLPLGVAALAAGIMSFGLVIPCMNQVWFVGPIAEKTGDIGFEVAFAVTGLLYIPFRWIELRVWGA
ncbi:NCS cytosine-purine permease [Gloeophyllum trabeum ATCC 11539]|uniref:NCS cytosine-purine permease n=1 Tax=Gloeophyllum trabeum (strain ATCC 11539 / FP-39264 / Madison 617) TaxID=670483 RepID=S7Q0S2_GLOTA|nr:NCS cytosine-purine permease [Gloeophyllum trabeum ATCC 11539]EPQ53521.1 NCS cytosine-purine permease [Gloeophyllum trabeum ATCC 11539]